MLEYPYYGGWRSLCAHSSWIVFGSWRGAGQCRQANPGHYYGFLGVSVRGGDDPIPVRMVMWGRRPNPNHYTQVLIFGSSIMVSCECVFNFLKV